LNKRNRAITLDSAKIRTLLRRSEIYTLTHFEDVFFEFLDGNVQGIESAPRNAYYDKGMQKKSATAIADFFRKSSYHELCYPMESKWSELVTNYISDESFFTFVPAPKSLGLIDHGFDKNKDLDRVPIGTEWHLQIKGEIDEEVLIIFRSDEKFFVLAPMTHPTAAYSNVITSESLNIPPKFVKFQLTEGIGRREFIVIKAPKIYFAAKTIEENFFTNTEELEVFSHRLINSKMDFKVDTYEFELVND
jgi:hypothetical protein